jgi:hypothetical protein
LIGPRSELLLYFQLQKNEAGGHSNRLHKRSTITLVLNSVFGRGKLVLPHPLHKRGFLERCRMAAVRTKLTLEGAFNS